MIAKPDGVNPSSRRLDMDRLDRLTRRFEKLFSFLVPITAVLAALFVMGILISSLGVNVFDAYSALLKGAFGSKVDLANTFNRATPLILAGLGVAFAFRGSLFNIGGEGQIMMGGVFATAAGIFVTGLPPWIHIPVCLLAGFIGGAFWGVIPGYFYAKSGVNLVITTIMMNEVARSVLAALVKGPMLEPPGYHNQTAMIAEAARLPLIWEGTRLHAGFLFAILMAVISYIVLFHTSFGYETRTVGANQVAARHAGMSVFKVQIMLMIISGGFGGLAGAVEIMGAQFRLREAFLMNYGYEALAVATLAQENPLVIILSGILFGALKVGSSGMQVTTKLPASFIQVVSGVIILFVIVSGILRHLPRIVAKERLVVVDNNFLSLFSADMLTATIRMAAPILFGAVGEVILQRSGIYNLGLEAWYIFGAFFGVLGAFVSGSVWVGLLTAMLAGVILGLLYGFIVITLRADQSVTGIAFIILGYGLTSFLLRVIWGVRDFPPYVDKIPAWHIPVLGDIPVIGNVFFNYNPLVYLAYLSVIGATYLLFKTTWGLRLRSVGEIPKAAATMGINVIRMRYAAAIIAGCMAAIGGAMLSLTELNMFVERMSGGRGFFALAAVIFGGWHPVGAMLGCLLFGAGTALQMRLQVLGVPISSDLLIGFPFILTLLFVIFSKSSAKPQSLGQPYQQEASIE